MEDKKVSNKREASLEVKNVIRMLNEAQRVSSTSEKFNGGSAIEWFSKENKIIRKARRNGCLNLLLRHGIKGIRVEDDLSTIVSEITDDNELHSTPEGGNNTNNEGNDNIDEPTVEYPSMDEIQWQKTFQMKLQIVRFKDPVDRGFALKRWEFDYKQSEKLRDRLY